MKNKYLYITLLALLGINAEATPLSKRSERLRVGELCSGMAFAPNEATPQSKRSEAFAPKDATAHSVPRLVVSIAIDQLSHDYLQAFAPLYGDKGFARLLREGLVCQRGGYAFSPVDRASAIAAIASGTTPYYNGIVASQWLNRETLRPVTCVDDSHYAGLLTSQNASPAAIAVSTLADELKVATEGKAIVHSIAPWREAAVLAGGHAADGAWWIDDHYGEWCTSQYYTKAVPQWLMAHNNSNAPRLRAYSGEWEPVSRQCGAFNYFTQSPIEKPFKHKFAGERRHYSYKLSGLVNREVTELALQCLTSTSMGNDRTTDLLCLTYYAGAFDGHPMNSCLPEVQDTYVRLDRELGRLIDFLYQRVDAKELLVVLTSTGYEPPTNEDYTPYRIPTGQLYINRTAHLLNMYLNAIYGQGNYVEAINRNQLYLNHKLLDTKKITLSDALSRSQELVAMMSGVRGVYTSLQLLTDQSEKLEKIRNAYNPTHCGDIIIEPAPGWHLINEDTQENQLWRTSFCQFPIIFYGMGIKAGSIDTPVTTDRIAPTIAHAIRIRAPNACQAEPIF